jgi:predicted metal-dependent HD superfamily phosphohydrolase
MIDRASLRDDLALTLSELGAAPGAADELFTDLECRYSTPDRHYHTLDHVGAVLAVLWLLSEPGPAAELLLAGWLHDVVYDTKATDNEEQSAVYARRVLGGLGVAPVVVDETARLILLTKSHACAEGDATGAILLDADLAILSTAEDVYDCYAHAIRAEYAWVPEADYRAGRRRVLEGFLARPRIYHTAAFAKTRQDRARANLRREIASLGGSPSSGAC